MSTTLIGWADIETIYGRKLNDRERWEKLAGITAKARNGKHVFYDRNEVIASVPVYDKAVNDARLARLASFIPQKPDNTAPLMRAVEALRVEQGAAFNLLMDELSKIKTQLVALEKTP